MSCQHTRQAEAFVDGILSQEEARAFATHLESCSACTDEVSALRDLLTELTLLGEEEISAPAHTWDAIFAEVESSNGSTSQSGGWFDWLRSHLLAPQGFALASFAFCAFFVVQHHIQTNRTQPPSHKARTPQRASMAKTLRRLPPGLHAVLTSISNARKHYEGAVRQLEGIAKTRLRQPKYKALQQTLVELDKAIAQCRNVIKQHPHSIDAQRILLAVYQRKVDLLRDVVLGNI